MANSGENVVAVDGKPSDGVLPRDEAFIKKEDINILILGETGVGKSTWINGIANYAKHNSLQDAMDDPDFTVLIPSRFVFTDEEGEGVNIEFGADQNEDLTSSGQSATQYPREYMLETNTTRFHLIDTPGIGDCRGIEKDKENFENILAFLTCYNKINAVVVLLKPNQSRLTVAFRFCVLELLTHLHKSLVSNIIFAFTNARGTFYRPGDSLPVLKKLLQEKKIGINLSRSNYFCFDNEAFRFLACYKSGIQFTSKEIDLYSESWVQSCETTCNLFDHVTNMRPHETKKTLSLNEARNYIIALSKPMAEVVNLIDVNVKIIEEEKRKCVALKAGIDSYQSDHYKCKGFDLKRDFLDYPMTVCAGHNCIKYVETGVPGVRNTWYPQICHDHCNIRVPVQTTNNEQLRGCAAMSGENCTRCRYKCSYRVHMHIDYKTTLIEKESILTPEAQKRIRENTDLKKKKESYIAELEGTIKELENERKIIVDCASYFGVFLKENAMMAYNDSFSEYLDMLIKQEDAKVNRDDKKIDQMKKDKQAYEEKKNVIEKNIASGSKDKNEVVPIEKIDEMRKKLCSLTHNGRTLKDAIDGVMLSRKKRHNEERKRCVYIKNDKSAKVSNFFKTWNI